MFIRNCLTPKRDLEILTMGTSIGDALIKMKEKRLYSLPVMNQDGQFVGILSKQSLFEYLETHPEIFTFSDFKKKPIDDCIDQSAQVFVDIEKDHFEDCLPIIVRHPFVPVVEENNQFVGIVKRSAIERALESAFGVNIPGVRIMLAVDDAEGTLRNLAEIITNFNVNIIAAIAFEAGESFVRRILLKIENSGKTEAIIEEIEENGYRVLEVNK